MITDLLLNQFRPSIFCFATEEAKKLYPHYRATVKDAFLEAVKKIPFQVRLIFGRGIDKNLNLNDINEDYDEKIDEMLLEASLISTRSCFSQSSSNLSAHTHLDLSYNEKVEKYHKIFDLIFSSLFSRTRFFPYFFLSDIPTCFLIIVAGNEELQFPQGVFPHWSLATIRKTKKTTMLLSPEAKETTEAEKQRFRINLINTLSKWLKTTFLDQYNIEINQVESDYIREWTGFTQALANFFNARDDPKTSLVILKAYADLKAQQGNYKEAELAYRKVCTNVKEKDDQDMLSESLFLLGCVQILESRNPLFFVDYSNKNGQGEINLNNLKSSNSSYFNNVDLNETISIFSSAKKHAFAVGKNEQAFLCSLLEFEVRRVVKAAPYKALMFIISTNLGKDKINIPNKPDIQFVTGFNTNPQLNRRLSINSNFNSNSNLNINPSSNALDASKRPSRRRFTPSVMSLCLTSASSPLNYHANGILRIILPFLLEMMSLYSRRRKRALFLALSAHAFLIRRKRILSLNNQSNEELSRSVSDNDLSDEDNFGGFLDPFFCASMLSDAADLFQNENWPLIRQSISLRAISINESLVELLVNVVGSRRLLLPDQTIRITNSFTYGQLQTQNSEPSQNSKKADQIRTSSLYATSPLPSSFNLALPCGFIETYVSDVYSHGFDGCPPPSMRNNDEWFALSERMFGSFNRGMFFSQLFRHSSSGSISASGSGGGTRSLNGSSIYEGHSSHLRCECCVGEKVFVRVALKMRNIRYDLFKFSLLVNEFPLNDGDVNGGEVMSYKQSVVKSSLNVKASRFCIVECCLSPNVPGRYEVYGVKFEWGNVTHLECPFAEQDPVIVLALPEFAAPRITLQVLPKQHLVPTKSDPTPIKSDTDNSVTPIKSDTDNSVTPIKSDTDNSVTPIKSDTDNSVTPIKSDQTENAHVVASPGVNKRLCVSSSSFCMQASPKRVLIPGQIFPLTVRITNTCGYDLSSLSMLIYTSGPIDCVLIKPTINGVFNRYCLKPLPAGCSVTLEVAIHALHDQEIEKDPTSVNNRHSDEAKLLLLFPFWTSPQHHSQSPLLPVKTSSQAATSAFDLFSPVPRFDFVELDFDIVGRRKKGGQRPSVLRSKSNSSIMSKLQSEKEGAKNKNEQMKIVKNNDHPLLNLTIEKCKESRSGVSILCPPKTFALGFSPFDNEIIKSHTSIINGRSAILNVASFLTRKEEGRVKLPSFCHPFVPKDKIAFWFSDNESVFFCFIEDELEKREKILLKKKSQQSKINDLKLNQKRINSQITIDNTDIELYKSVYENRKLKLSMFAFLGGIEVSSYFIDNNSNVNEEQTTGCLKKKLRIDVKNVSGMSLNNVAVEIVQKKNDQFVQCILSGKLKYFIQKLKDGDSICFTLVALMFTDSCLVKVAFNSDEIRTLLPINITAL